MTWHDLRRGALPEICTFPRTIDITWPWCCLRLRPPSTLADASVRVSGFPIVQDVRYSKGSPAVLAVALPARFTRCLWQGLKRGPSNGDTRPDPPRVALGPLSLVHIMVR